MKNQATGSNIAGTTRKFGITGLAAFLLAIFVMNHGLVAGEASASIDDGWRLTKDGWEHISTWPVAASEALIERPPTTAAQISPAVDRWLLLHPSVLAIGICVAAGTALLATKS